MGYSLEDMKIGGEILTPEDVEDEKLGPVLMEKSRNIWY